MRTTLQLVSDTQIKNATAISAIDPNVPTYSQQLSGQNSVAAGVSPGAPAHPSSELLEIEIDSSDDSQLQDLMSKIETVKGHLPPDVDRLRKPK